MPIALDTNEIYRYVISTDRSKEIAPTLLFHYPTCREARQIAAKFDEADKASSVDDLVRLSCEAIQIILAGWEHVTDRAGNVIKYNPSELDTVLTLIDFDELRAKLLKDMSASELEKKRSALFPPVNTVNSASDAKEQSA
jgi:hypothetical protein